MKMKLGILAKACLLLVAAGGAIASSHREAPGTAGSPRVDGTDFYMFRSYEGINADGTGGRSDYVTLLANYQPLQAPYGGPNYFQLDSNALYEIHIDNNGDAKEDLTFQFRFKNKLNSIPLTIGSASVPIPLVQAGAVSNFNDANLNVNESYEVKVVRNGRRNNAATALTKTTGGSATFEKPVDNIGYKTFGGPNNTTNDSPIEVVTRSNRSDIAGKRVALNNHWFCIVVISRNRRAVRTANCNIKSVNDRAG